MGEEDKSPGRNGVSGNRDGGPGPRRDVSAFGSEGKGSKLMPPRDSLRYGKVRSGPWLPPLVLSPHMHPPTPAHHEVKTVMATLSRRFPEVPAVPGPGRGVELIIQTFRVESSPSKVSRFEPILMLVPMERKPNFKICFCCALTLATLAESAACRAPIGWDLSFGGKLPPAFPCGRSHHSRFSSCHPACFIIWTYSCRTESEAGGE